MPGSNRSAVKILFLHLKALCYAEKTTDDLKVAMVFCVPPALLSPLSPLSPVVHGWLRSQAGGDKINLPLQSCPFPGNGRSLGGSTAFLTLSLLQSQPRSFLLLFEDSISKMIAPEHFTSKLYSCKRWAATRWIEVLQIDLRRFRSLCKRICSIWCPWNRHLNGFRLPQRSFTSVGPWMKKIGQ